MVGLCRAIGGVIGEGGGTQKSNIYCLGTSRRYVTISTPPRVPPQKVFPWLFMGGVGKCNIAGVPPYKAHVTFFTTPPNPYISKGGIKM